jgi:hypothetical protein
MSEHKRKCCSPKRYYASVRLDGKDYALYEFESEFDLSLSGFPRMNVLGTDSENEQSHRLDITIYSGCLPEHRCIWYEEFEVTFDPSVHWGIELLAPRLFVYGRENEPLEWRIFLPFDWDDDNFLKSCGIALYDVSDPRLKVEATNRFSDDEFLRSCGIELYFTERSWEVADLGDYNSEP